MIERIYEVAGLPITDVARAQIAEYARSHARGAEGQVVYDLRRDFGAEPHTVREPFGFYFERFPVKVEVA